MHSLDPKRVLMSSQSSGDASRPRLLTVGAEYAGQRIDNFLLTALKGAPRSLVYRILRTGEVRVNKGRIKPEYRLQAGDEIRVPPIRLSEAAPAPQPGQRVLHDLAGRILYEKDGLLVLNKPAGLAVHGGSGVSYGVIEALRAMRPEARFLELVHRLDRDTSGLLMVAERRSVLSALHEQLRDGKMEKVYVALLAGRLRGREHRVEAPLKKNVLASGERIVRVARDGKEAVTLFRVIEQFDKATLVEARPLTGRTHQIRVHAQQLGHPIVGDDKYTSEEINRSFRPFGLERLFLHAHDLTIRVPGQKAPLTLHAPLEPELLAGLEVLRRG